MTNECSKSPNSNRFLDEFQKYLQFYIILVGERKNTRIVWSTLRILLTQWPGSRISLITVCSSSPVMTWNGARQTWPCLECIWYEKPIFMQWRRFLRLAFYCDAAIIAFIFFMFSVNNSVLLQVLKNKLLQPF